MVAEQTVISKEDFDNKAFVAVATCRYWYDDKKYDKPYCCTMYTSVGAEFWGPAAIADGKETKEAKEHTMADGSKFKFQTYVADGATMVAGAAATLLAAASMF